MKKLSVFDVIGPKMIGPSSSHTAGALRISKIAREFVSGAITKANFTLYGSFAETYQGHGTDRALVGGALGYDTSDLRIRDSFQYAKEAGMEISFTVDKTTLVAHANTVEVVLEGENEQKISIMGVSIGGGEVEIREINGVEVQFRGEYYTLLVQQKDKPGIVAYITQQLGEAGINIAFMRLYRKAKDDLAYMIVEADHEITEEIIERMTRHKDVDSATLIKGW